MSKLNSIQVCHAYEGQDLGLARFSTARQERFADSHQPLVEPVAYAQVGWGCLQVCAMLWVCVRVNCEMRM